MVVRKVLVILGGVLSGLAPFLVGYLSGWRVDVIAGDPWPLLLFPVGNPLMVFWFYVADRVNLMRTSAGSDWLDENGRWCTTFFAWFCLFLVPIEFFHQLIGGGVGIFVGVPAAVVISITFLRLLQGLDWVQTINRDFSSPEVQDRSQRAPIWAFLGGPLIAGVGTLIVVLILASPDFEAMAAGSHEMWGYVIGRILIAFGIGAVLARFLGSDRISFHWRLNFAALVVGFLNFLVV